MPSEGGFARHAQGVIVLAAEREPILLEFSAFLRRIASGAIGPDDVAVSRIFTNGERRRVGDLRLYARIRDGQMPTQDLPVHAPNGVLAMGEQARIELRRIEGDFPPNRQALLTPANAPQADKRDLLRVPDTLPAESPDELPRPADRLGEKSEPSRFRFRSRSGG